MNDAQVLAFFLLTALIAITMAERQDTPMLETMGLRNRLGIFGALTCVGVTLVYTIRMFGVVGLLIAIGMIALSALAHYLPDKADKDDD